MIWSLNSSHWLLILIHELVTMGILSFIRGGVRKNSLMCKFVMLHFLSHTMIGLKYVNFVILTNQTLRRRPVVLRGLSTISLKMQSEATNGHLYFLLFSLLSNTSSRNLGRFNAAQMTHVQPVEKL